MAPTYVLGRDLRVGDILITVGGEKRITHFGPYKGPLLNQLGDGTRLAYSGTWAITVPAGQSFRVFKTPRPPVVHAVQLHEREDGLYLFYERDDAERFADAAQGEVGPGGEHDSFITETPVNDPADTDALIAAERSAEE